MLVIKTCLEDLDFDQLMLLYVEGNEENAAVLYPELPKEVGIRRAEQDFYAFLRDKFFQKKDVQYALWEEKWGIH